MSARVPNQWVEGDVLAVLYSAEESGWTVFDLRDDTNGGIVRATGVAPGVSAGERVRARGQWADTSYGTQFKCWEIQVFPPTSADGLEAFLSSGAIAGVGPQYARKLVKRYGTELIEILDTRPGDIESVRGIGPERRRRICEAWKRHRGVRDVMMFLAEHGISSARAKRIHEKFGDASVTIVRARPYRLTEVSGFGFLTADAIARKLGVDAQAPERLRAGVVHVLESAAAYGHCGMRVADAIGEASRLLQSEHGPLQEALASLVEKGKVVGEVIGGEHLVFLPRLARAEEEIALTITRLATRPPWWGRPSAQDSQAALADAEARCGITLSASQNIAASMALTNSVLLITGGPGCGKTTTTRVVLAMLEQRGGRIALAAPTGRAAKRLSEVTGRPASTIHRLVGQSIKEPREIDANVVLVDESSMIDAELMVRLLRGLRPDTVLILVGDADQLPSVAPGRVFGDLIASRRIATATLTEVHRQAAGSPIVSAAHEVRQGRIPALASRGDCVGVTVGSREEVADVIEDLITRVLPDEYGLDVLNEVVVLSPMRKGPAGAIALNERLQRRLNPRAGEAVRWGGTPFAVGDRVLNTENDYARDTLNGDIGFITRIDTGAGELDVCYDGRVVTYGKDETDPLLLGYALTIHKSQGSEFPAVVVALAREHYKLLSRRLVYTGLSRAKKAAFVVSEDGAMGLAVRTDNEERVTSLRERAIRCWSAACSPALA